MHTQSFADRKVDINLRDFRRCSVTCYFLCFRDTLALQLEMADASVENSHRAMNVAESKVTLIIY